MFFHFDKRNTRLSFRMTYALPKTRTSYGIFDIRYQGAKIWNAINDNIKLLSLKQFKKKLKSSIIASYWLNLLYNTSPFFSSLICLHTLFSCLFSLNIVPYLPVYKSTFYSLKIGPKNRPWLIHGSKTEIKKGSGQISIIIVSYAN